MKPAVRLTRADCGLPERIKAPYRRKSLDHVKRIVWVIHSAGLISAREGEIPFSTRWKRIAAHHARRFRGADVLYHWGIGSIRNTKRAVIAQGRPLDRRSGAEGPLKRAWLGSKGHRVAVMVNTGYRGKGGKWRLPTQCEKDALFEVLLEGLERWPDAKHIYRRHGTLRHGGKGCPGPGLDELCGRNPKSAPLPGERMMYHLINYIQRRDAK